MGDTTIKKTFRDGMFHVQVNDGDEFEVHPDRWNDPSQRAWIIAAELGTDPQPWMGANHPKPIRWDRTIRSSSRRAGS
jgi:hypothetical protein